MDAPDTRALNRDVYLKAHEMARLSLCVITCGDVNVPADSSDSGIWFLRIPREMLIICQGVAGLNGGELISLFIMQLCVYNGDRKDNLTRRRRCGDSRVVRVENSVRSTGTMPGLISTISLLALASVLEALQFASLNFHVLRARGKLIICARRR